MSTESESTRDHRPVSYVPPHRQSGNKVGKTPLRVAQNAYKAYGRESGESTQNGGRGWASDDIPVDVRGKNIPEPARSFQKFGLGKCLVNNIKRCRYVKPKQFQIHAVPIAMAGRDLLACAPTGSGKTAAYCISIIDGVLTKCLASSGAAGRTAFPVALILSPTKELASQIYEEVKKLTHNSRAKVAIVYAGALMGHQLDELGGGVDILVTTPGQSLDLMERSQVSFKKIKYLALDEADRMLEIGFEPQIKKIVEQMPPPGTRQTLIFSATSPRELQRLAADLLKNYISLTVGKVGSNTALVAHKVEFVMDTDKLQHLCTLLKNQRDNGTQGKLALTLVFVETMEAAYQLENGLSRNGFPTIAILGEKLDWKQALRVFICDATPILVATDLASRGLDIPHVAHVINFDFPKSIEDYVHRICRTGLAGKSGLSTAFFSEKNQPLAKALVQLLKETNQEVPTWLNDLAEQSSPNGGDPRKFGSSYFGRYDFHKSDNYYGSGSYGYGASSVGAGGATCCDISGSYASRSNNGSETGNIKDIVSKDEYRNPAVENCSDEANKKILATTGTINLMYCKPGEFIGGADTRETFLCGGHTYITNEISRKIVGLQNNMFVLFCGACPIGTRILEHLEARLTRYQNQQPQMPQRPISIRRLAFTAYCRAVSLAGTCCIYFGGIENGVNVLYKMIVKHSPDENTFNTELKPVRLNSEDIILDGDGSTSAKMEWESNGVASQSFLDNAAKLLLRAGVAVESCGGSNTLIHIKTRNRGNRVTSTIEQKTVVDWYIQLYGLFAASFLESQLFVIIEKNDLGGATVGEYLYEWYKMEVQARGYMQVGSPLGKLQGTNYFLVQVEVSKYRRDSILAMGIRTVNSFLSFNVRQVEFKNRRFYISKPSRELLASLKFERNVGEESLIPPAGLAYAGDGMELPL